MCLRAYLARSPSRTIVDFDDPVTPKPVELWPSRQQPGRATLRPAKVPDFVFQRRHPAVRERIRVVPRHSVRVLGRDRHRVLRVRRRPAGSLLLLHCRGVVRNLKGWLETAGRMHSETMARVVRLRLSTACFIRQYLAFTPCMFASTPAFVRHAFDKVNFPVLSIMWIASLVSLSEGNVAKTFSDSKSNRKYTYALPTSISKQKIDCCVCRYWLTNQNMHRASCANDVDFSHP
jgi:hypothetical protein